MNCSCMVILQGRSKPQASGVRFTR
jgi:hypothetical protein